MFFECQILQKIFSVYHQENVYVILIVCISYIAVPIVAKTS